MKKISLFLFATISFQFAFAQLKEGTIIYEEKIDVHRRIPKEDEQMKAMMPQFRTSDFELLFHDNKSIYRAAEPEPDITEQPQGGGGIVIRFGGADNVFFKDFNKQQLVEKRDLMDQSFIVEDSIHNINWKLIDAETKTINGHVCKKATGKSEKGMDLIAWYAEDIAVSTGPAQFCGLPGMILALDVNNGEIVYTVKEIQNKVDKKEVKAPTEGKKVSPAEFEKNRKEIMGDGPVRKIIRN